MGKYDAIYKTGNARHIATPPEEDRDTITRNVHRKFGEVLIYGFRDMRDMFVHMHTHGQTANRRTYSSQYSLLPYWGGVIAINSVVDRFRSIDGTIHGML